MGRAFPVIEIVKRGISKARGIDQVKDYLGIEPSHIIAFGDEDNDIEMIKYAKYGIAMDNGLDELKHIKTILLIQIMMMVSAVI